MRSKHRACYTVLCSAFFKLYLWSDVIVQSLSQRRCLSSCTGLFTILLFFNNSDKEVQDGDSSWQALISLLQHWQFASASVVRSIRVTFPLSFRLSLSPLLLPLPGPDCFSGRGVTFWTAVGSYT